MHTLLFYEPGHFHAALTLRSHNPRVAADVHVYAHPGQDRGGFLGLVDAFNSRDANPTHWRVRIHEEDDPLTHLIEERCGDVVVLAGRNVDKLATIARLHEAGFNVLADKPWLTSHTALPCLRQATSGPPLAMDIMTERHEILARVRRRVVASPRVFGEFVRGSERPGIEIASVHHLYKVVNGQPLRRPWWYYDVGIQGDGLVDIQSHLTDQVQWMVLGDQPGDCDRDIELLTARRWATPVPLDLYRESTGQSEFPDALSGYINDGVLALPCNGEIEYSLKGVRVRQRTEWGQREPPGSTDFHPCLIRGTRCDFLVRHGPEAGYVAKLYLEPVPGVDIDAALSESIADWQEDFPGLDLTSTDNGFELVVPEALRSTHESHFAMVLESFLDYLDAGRWPQWLTQGVRMRYELLARSRELALR